MGAAARAKMVSIETSDGSHVRIDATGGRGLDAHRFAQIQGPHRGIKIMAEEITNGSCAEIPEISPGDRVVNGAVRAALAWPQPKVPVDALGSGFRGRLAPQHLLVPP